MTVAAGHGFEEVSNFLGEGMFAAVAGAMIATRVLARDASAANAWSIARTGVAPTPALSKHDGTVAGPKGEVAPWRAYLQHVADLHLLVDVGARHAMWLALDAYAIAIGR